jgi:hypothetical protein
MTTEQEVTLPDALAWLKTHTGAYPAKILEFVKARENENNLLRKEIKSAYDLLNNNLVAMQACVIETEHNGHEAGYSWIWNTLCGPGLIPEPDEEWYESAQLYYSANISEPFGPCGICGKPSNTSASHGVSCCEEHNKQLRTNKAGA